MNISEMIANISSDLYLILNDSVTIDTSDTIDNITTKVVSIYT